MYKHLIIAIFPIFFLFPAIVPQLLQAQVSQHSDVNVKNFPETQQIKGDVHVNNFPELQQIKGSVSIEGTTKFITREGLVVPTSQRAELPEMVYAGTIETDGFTSLLISLQGEMRSEVFSSGTIGVLLIPDEMPILRILRDAKRIQFPIECKVQARVVIQFILNPNRFSSASPLLAIKCTFTILRTNQRKRTFTCIYQIHR